MKKILLTIAAIGGLVILTFAQQAPQYTNFMFNQLAYNPAYAGSNEVLTMSAIYRNQWSGIDGAPKTINFNVHTPFFNDRCGAGLSVMNDVTGLINSTNINLSYNYRLPVAENSTLAMGLMGRLETGRINWQAVQAIDLSDQMIGMDEESYRLKPNFGAGLYLSSSKYYIGISAPQLLKNSLYSDLNDNVGDVRTYYLTGGLVTNLSENVKFKPAVLLSYNQNAPFEIDLNANFIFMDAFWVGASYRLGDSVDALFGYQFNPQLRAGVAVDFTLSELNDYTAGGFEIMLQYSMWYKEGSVNNLRYF